jgi:hypothetical protein
MMRHSRTLLVVLAATLGCGADQAVTGNTPAEESRIQPASALSLQAQHYASLVAYREGRVNGIKARRAAGHLSIADASDDVQVEKAELEKAKVWLSQLTSPTGASMTIPANQQWDLPYPPSPAYMSGTTDIVVRRGEITASTAVTAVPAHLTLNIQGQVTTQNGSFPMEIPYDPLTLPLWSIAHTWQLPGGADCTRTSVQANATTTHGAGWDVKGMGILPFSKISWDADDCPHIASIVTVTLNASTLRVGEVTQANAVAKDSHGTVINCTIAWESGNTAIATVSSSGTVTAVLGGGYAPIIGSCNEGFGYAQVTTENEAPPPPPDPCDNLLTDEVETCDPGNPGGGGNPPGGGTLDETWVRPAQPGDYPPVGGGTVYCMVTDHWDVNSAGEKIGYRGYTINYCWQEAW